MLVLQKEKGSIPDITLNTKLFERIVSMGIFPGKKIEVMVGIEKRLFPNLII